MKAHSMAHFQKHFARLFDVHVVSVRLLSFTPRLRVLMSAGGRNMLKMDRASTGQSKVDLRDKFQRSSPGDLRRSPYLRGFELKE
jgi:hypothetical protein